MEIKLEKFEVMDIQRLISWVPTEEFLLQFAGPQYKFPFTDEQLLADIKKMETTDEIIMFKVIDEATQLTIGHIQLLRIDMTNKTGVIGRVLIGEESARGHGIGTKVIQKALDYGFNIIGLGKISLNVFDFNIGATRCYKKVGFRIVDTIENSVRVKGTEWNSYVMEISKEEFMNSEV